MGGPHLVGHDGERIPVRGNVRFVCTGQAGKACCNLGQWDDSPEERSLHFHSFTALERILRQRRILTHIRQRQRNWSRNWRKSGFPSYRLLHWGRTPLGGVESLGRNRMPDGLFGLYQGTVRPCLRQVATKLSVDRIGIGFEIGFLLVRIGFECSFLFKGISFKVILPAEVVPHGEQHCQQIESFFHSYCFIH